MNTADWHLLLAHTPVFGVLFGLGLMLLGLGKRSEDLKRASLLIFALVGVIALPTYLTGEPTLKFLKVLTPAMPTEAGEQHQEIAIVALVAILVLGAISLLALLIYRKKQPLARWTVATALVLALAGSTLMIWTANLGGKVRHTEIRKVQ